MIELEYEREKWDWLQSPSELISDRHERVSGMERHHGLLLVGLGLYDEQSITLEGLEALKECDTIYLERYTSTMHLNITRLEAMIGRPIRQVKREEVESDAILAESTDQRVALLVPGDPLTATTHVTLYLDALRAGIPTHVIHGTSIWTAAPGLLGLQIYKFGRATTLPSPGEFIAKYPESPYDVIRDNRPLHTLVLLSPGMTANEGITILEEVERKRKDGVFTSTTLIGVVGGAGGPHPVVRAGPVSALRGQRFGPLPHCLIVPGKLHFMEEEALPLFAGSKSDQIRSRNMGKTP